MMFSTFYFINLQGDIATCAGTHLFYWSINGELIADINTETGMNQQIYCVAMSQVESILNCKHIVKLLIHCKY